MSNSNKSSNNSAGKILKSWPVISSIIGVIFVAGGLFWIIGDMRGDLKALEGTKLHIEHIQEGIDKIEQNTTVITNALHKLETSDKIQEEKIKNLGIRVEKLEK